MVWDELKLMDAILCGHDHFYERLDYFGTPLFITGAGGQFLYTFRDPPDTRSLSRYNIHHSAMRIVADDSALRLENRAYELPAQQETLVESIVLGTPAPVDNEDRYTFFAEAGETIQLRTATPPPLSQPPLDPALELFTPAGQPVPPDSVSSPDTRNVLLTHVATHTGRWQVKVTAPVPGRGPYTLKLTTLSPSPEYTAWSAALPSNQRALNADPDHDGLTNLVEYAVQSPPLRAGIAMDDVWQGLRLEHNRAMETVTATFDLPSPLPPGISYQLESTPQPAGPWRVIAWRPAASDWQGSPEAVILTGGPLPGARRTAVTLSADQPRLFFRLSMVRNG